jgi:hypothetical protein
MSNTQLQSLLVTNRLITADQMQYTREHVSADSDYTWLELLILWNLVEEQHVLHCIEAAARVPRCDLDRMARIPHDVLALVPFDVCVEHRLVPVGVEPDGDIRVAMVDPTDECAVEELEFFCDRRILREAAPASAIAWALHHYYGAASALWPPGQYDRSAA